jgi:hypothetical protein
VCLGPVGHGNGNGKLTSVWRSPGGNAGHTPRSSPSQDALSAATDTSIRSSSRSSAAVDGKQGLAVPADLRTLLRTAHRRHRDTPGPVHTPPPTLPVPLTRVHGRTWFTKEEVWGRGLARTRARHVLLVGVSARAAEQGDLAILCPCQLWVAWWRGWAYKVVFWPLCAFVSGPQPTSRSLHTRPHGARRCGAAKVRVQSAVGRHRWEPGRP